MGAATAFLRSIRVSSTWLYAAVAGLPVMVVSGIQTQPGPAQVLWPGGQIPVHEPLRFRPDGTFQISIFEDLHFGENAWDAWGPQQDIQSVKVIETVLATEPHIDLVVLNGDLITGENTFLENSTHYVDQIVQPFLKRGLTWASTYGNHDNDFNISSSAILARERLWPHSRTASMVPDPAAVGVSNYYLPVFPADCHHHHHHTCTPELLLWFFDSRGGFEFQRTQNAITSERVGRPNWVDARVAAWFQQTSTALAHAAGRRSPIPSLAFVHIPTNASLALQERGVDVRRQPGIDDDAPLAQQAQGWCPDGEASVGGGGCAYGGQDGPFMRAVTSTPGLMALFSGHDHGDTWCYKWEGLLPGMEVKGNGVNLCFGQRSGYGGYGSWIRGARQIVVTLEGLKDLAVDTYIRLESGESVGAVTLNRTYGADEYPVTPNDRTKLPPAS